MKTFFLTRVSARIALLALISACGIMDASETDAQVAARQRNLDFAGAFTNDGYKIRDGYWLGSLEPGKPIFLEVNLYAGNSYWFLASAPTGDPKIEVTVFDETGREVEGNLYSETGKGAAGIAPATSGPFYVRIQLANGLPTDVCFTYCYK